MFIYNGKLNYSSAAENETITIVFPAGFALNDPVSAYWQWSTDRSFHTKASVASSGAIQSLTKATDGSPRIFFSFGYYRFNVTVSADFRKLSGTASALAGGDQSAPFELTVMHVNPTRIPSTVVYTGSLDWLSYAKDEMTTLVVPYGVAEGMFFGLYHQWTVDAQGVVKANMPVNGVFQNVRYGADGTTTASFKAATGYYTYNFTFKGKDGSFDLSNPSGHKSLDNKFIASYSL